MPNWRPTNGSTHVVCLAAFDFVLTLKNGRLFNALVKAALRLKVCITCRYLRAIVSPRSLSTLLSIATREQCFIHQLGPIADLGRRELHLLEDVPSDVDALCDFCQRQPFGSNLEYGTLGDDLGTLPPFYHTISYEVGNLLRSIDELADLALLDDAQTMLAGIN